MSTVTEGVKQVEPLPEPSVDFADSEAPEFSPIKSAPGARR